MHTHPCRHHGCSQTVPCDGDLEQNYDGEPAVICVAYHLDLGRIARVECEDCAASRCPECGSVLRLESHDEDCTAGTLSEACWR